MVIFHSNMLVHQRVSERQRKGPVHRVVSEGSRVDGRDRSVFQDWSN